MVPVIITISFLTFAIIIISIILVDQLIHPNTIEYNKACNEALEFEGITREAFDKREKQSIQIQSSLGYTLQGTYFPNGDSKKTMILVHGITCSLWASLKYVDMFYKHGFNVLIYDHRNHGKSGADFTTFGLYESDDVKTWVDYIYSRNGKDSIIGLHGESMGAATAVIAAGKDERIRFVIEDCGYSETIPLFSIRCREDKHLPSFPFVPIALWLIHLVYKVNLAKASPLDTVKRVEIPMLFIHGAADAYVPTFMGKDLYAAKKGYKQLHIFEESKHAKSYIDHKDRYHKVVERFLKDIHIIEA